MNPEYLRKLQRRLEEMAAVTSPERLGRLLCDAVIELLDQVAQIEDALK